MSYIKLLAIKKDFLPLNKKRDLNPVVSWRELAKIKLLQDIWQVLAFCDFSIFREKFFSAFKEGKFDLSFLSQFPAQTMNLKNYDQIVLPEKDSIRLEVNLAFSSLKRPQPVLLWYALFNPVA